MREILDAVADRYSIFESADASLIVISNTDVALLSADATPAALREAAMWLMLLATDREMLSVDPTQVVPTQVASGGTTGSTTDDDLTTDEIKALLWATAAYSDVTDVTDKVDDGRSISLIRSARAKLKRQGGLSARGA